MSKWGLEYCSDRAHTITAPVTRDLWESAPGPIQDHNPAIIGSSTEIQALRKMIASLSKSRVPVLILGETGVGKELVARALHASAPWHAGPFVPIDCGGLPSALIESELFGYEHGAFTGATQHRTGLLLQAGKGTVFLDEMANLPIEAQVKLLRVLEEHQVRPIGSNQMLPFGARVVAASNQDLEQAVKQGRFRKDLFYRLNVVSIDMPALRERKGDIPALIAQFAKRSQFARREVCGISPEALAYLCRYDWPGNVRELKNCVERALALGNSSRIEVEDLPPQIVRQPATASTAPSTPSSLREIERRAIASALQASGGHAVRAARTLAIGRTTIYRKIKEYGLTQSSVGTWS